MAQPPAPAAAVRTYTAKEFRAALKRFRGTQLQLDSVVQLAPDTALVLLEHDVFHVSLGGLKTLTPEVAAILARRGGSLSFESLEQISDETAAALSAHSGWLSLDGVKSLSATAAASLVKHEHSLSLRGIREMSDAVAQSLCSYSGILRLSKSIGLSDASRAALSAAAVTIQWE
jgi:hypothetical protein